MARKLSEKRNYSVKSCPTWCDEEFMGIQKSKNFLRTRAHITKLKHNVLSSLYRWTKGLVLVTWGFDYRMFSFLKLGHVYSMFSRIAHHFLFGTFIGLLSQ